MEKPYFNGIECPHEYILALKDALNVTTGKWKLAIVSSLLWENKRFTDIQKMINGITPRMLSKELKELELNGIVVRRVYDSTPVLIEYELTPSGRKLNEVINTMIEWGLNHRKQTVEEMAELA